MKKRISILLVCVIAIFGFCLTSCADNKQQDKHTFGNEWVSDADSHWHECECGEKDSVSAHRFNNSICLECGYNKGHEHVLTFMDKVEPYCDVKGTESHYRCEKCGKLFSDEAAQYEVVGNDLAIPTVGHAHEEAWLSDNNYHWQIATCDQHRGREVNKALHVMGEGNVCKFCGKGYGTGENDIKTTPRLSFSLTDDNSAYYLDGIGTTTEKNLVIPATYLDKPVIGIKDQAFCSDLQNLTGENIESIILPYGMKTIGRVAFCACKSLKYASLPETIESIGVAAFDYCSALEEITIPSKVKSIEQIAFAEAKALKKVTFETSVVEIDGKETVIGVETLGSGAFMRCSSLEEVILPNTVKEIKEFAFGECVKLNNVVIPDSLEKMGVQVFVGSLNIQTLSVPFIGVSRDEAYHLGYLFDANFALNDEELRDPVESNKNNVPQTLISLNITNPLTIADYSFAGCPNIRNIMIGSSFLTLGRNAFEGCDNLNYNMYKGGKYIGDAKNPYVALVGIENNKYSDFEVNEKAIAIDGGIFNACKTLKNITLPDTLVSTGSGIFTGCYNLNYNEYEGGLYLGSKNNKYLAFVKPATTALTSINIHKDTKIIMGGAFANCGLLSDVALPEGLVSVGSEAFYYCRSLSGIVMPESVKAIGSAAFSACTRLRDFTTVGIVSVGNNVFENCISLENVAIPALLAYFVPKDNLKVVTVTGGGEIIQSTFAKAPLLEKVVLSEGVTGVEQKAFDSCYTLKEIIISDTVTHIDDFAFEYCYGLENVSLGAGIKTISEYAFDYCVSLKNLVVSKNNEKYYSSGNCIIEGRPGVKGGRVIVGSYRSVIPNDGSVTTLGIRSFYGKRGKSANTSAPVSDKTEYLTSIFIPESVVVFEDGCLAALIECVEIRYGGTQAQWSRISKGENWDYSMGGATGDGDVNYKILYEQEP